MEYAVGSLNELADLVRRHVHLGQAAFIGRVRITLRHCAADGAGGLPGPFRNRRKPTEGRIVTGAREPERTCD
jgi:hypothetical protein